MEEILDREFVVDIFARWGHLPWLDRRQIESDGHNLARNWGGIDDLESPESLLFSVLVRASSDGLLSNDGDLSNFDISVDDAKVEFSVHDAIDIQIYAFIFDLQHDDFLDSDLHNDAFFSNRSFTNILNPEFFLMKEFRFERRRKRDSDANEITKIDINATIRFITEIDFVEFEIEGIFSRIKRTGTRDFFGEK